MSGLDAHANTHTFPLSLSFTPRDFLSHLLPEIHSPLCIAFVTNY